jgi:quercetin dioxygenase-like cupin family protein
MEIERSGTQPSQKGPPEWFTGKVRIDSMFQRTEPARLGGAIVMFEPGARTAWHTHPLGQTLIVISGVGWTQCEGGLSKKSAPVTLSGARRTTSTGMVRQRQRR